MMKFTWWLYISITLSSPLATNPLMLGTLLLVMAFLLMTFLSMSQASWLALILFIIFVSGTLVMFSYFLSTQPNQPLKMMLPMIGILTNMAILLFSKMYSSNQMLHSMPPLTPLMHNNNTPTMMFLVSSLLLTMIIVVNNTMNMGSLRPFKIFI